MAHDTAAHAAENDRRADRRLYIADDRGAAQGDVDDAAAMHLAVRQDRLEGWVARDDALVSAFLGKPETITVDEPGELIGDLLALMQARHGGETAVHRAGHHGLDPPEMIQVGHDAFAYLTSDRGWEGHATRRHVDDLARMILLVLGHEAAGDANWHTAYRRRSGTIFGLTWSAWARLRRVGMGSAGAGAPSRRLMLMRLGRCSGSSRSLWLSRGSMGLALSE